MLKIQNLNKSFGTRKALEDINLHVNSGEFVSILGPSGCGKTTLLRAIGGLEHPDSGKILLEDRDITRTDAHKRNIHTVFQRYALFPHMNVYDNIAFGLRCKKMPESEIKTKVQEALELVGLQNYATRSTTTLSGGEQQRVALVRALVNTPKLLLLDEPLGALDAKIRLQIQTELVTIQKRIKTTFVFVTHDQHEALIMSDRVVVMEKGRVAQFGTPNEIYESPANLYVANFVGKLNQIRGRLTDRQTLEVSGVGEIKLHEQFQKFQHGDHLTLGIRPEKLSITSKRSTIANSFEAQLLVQVYLGTHTQFDVQLKNGTKLHVFQQNSARASKREFQSGDRVFVNWPAERGYLFSEQTS